MKIGIAYNLREEEGRAAGAPVDIDEEFDSPETIEAIAEVLTRNGHTVSMLGFGRPFLDSILADPPDFVFNIAEGSAGRCRESQVPAILEMLSIPYSGADPLTLGLTLDKDLAKRIVHSAGLATAGHVVFRDDKEVRRADVDSLRFPLIVKPACEGSSMGIRLNSKVHTVEEMRERAAWLFAEYGRPVMVEEFLNGHECTVGIVGNSSPRVLGIMMIRHRTLPPEEFVYSLEVKRDWENQVEYLVPPPLTEKEHDAVSSLALGVYDALGCRDVSRVDIRFHDGNPYFIEVNPLPGLSPKYGDLVIMARAMGTDYESLLLEILDHALVRTGKGGGRK